MNIDPWVVIQKEVNSLKITTIAILTAGLMVNHTISSANEILFEENFNNIFGAAFGEKFTASTKAYVRNGAVRLSGGSNYGELTSMIIDAQGYSNLTLSFKRSTKNLDRDEYGAVFVSIDGGDYTMLEGLKRASGYTTLALGDNANNSKIQLKFQVNANKYRESYTVDNIVLKGDFVEFECSPGPSSEFLDGGVGTFEVSSFAVQGTATTFNNGTIYYPSDSPDGCTYGVVAVYPGYRSSEEHIDWLGPFLASNGFIALTMESFDPAGDDPNERAPQMVAGLNYVVNEALYSGSPIYEKLDRTKKAVMGHSMGGGASLKAVLDNPYIRAAVPLTPHYRNFLGVYNGHDHTIFDEITVPTLIVGCEEDNIADVELHAKTFYNTIPSSTDKGYVEMPDIGHFCALEGFPLAPGDAAIRTKIVKYGISWLKIYVDGDTRYSEFFCQEDTSLSSSFNNICPP
jgi:dienelactone hydrolase